MYSNAVLFSFDTLKVDLILLITLEVKDFEPAHTKLSTCTNIIPCKILFCVHM